MTMSTCEIIILHVDIILRRGGTCKINYVILHVEIIYLACPAVTWLKYCRYGVKLYPISIYSLQTLLNLACRGQKYANILIISFIDIAIADLVLAWLVYKIFVRMTPTSILDATHWLTCSVRFPKFSVSVARKSRDLTNWRTKPAQHSAQRGKIIRFDDCECYSVF